MQRHIWIAVILAGAGLLSGCDTQDDQNAATAAAINKAIAAAQAKADPWTAAEALTNDVRQALNANPVCARGECNRAPMVLRFEEARWGLIESALDRAIPQALALTFARGVAMGDPAISETSPHDIAPEKISKWASSLLVLADAAGGADAGQRSLILAAGNLLENGRYIERDTYRATGLYARAWLAGSTPAAGAAARAYLGVGDVRNAYLWAIRCVNDCNLGAIARKASPNGVPDPRFNTDALQALLTPEAAIQAQKAAADRSVLELEFPAALMTTTAGAAR